jgi:putative acetyltransferase
MELKIRNEQKSDFRAVEELTREAFWNVHFPGCNEHFCLHNMRDSADFIPELDLVAEMNGKIIANIVYTQGKIVDAAGKISQVICFGPVSVLPIYQGQGVGGTLINYSLDKARALGFRVVCIYGDPRYYHRFGFRCAERYDIQTFDGKFAVALMALGLVPEALRDVTGRFVESASFEVDENEFQKYEETFPPKEKAETESQSVFKVLVSLRY